VMAGRQPRLQERRVVADLHRCRPGTTADPSIGRRRLSGATGSD
jgi:hypothetical protein